MVPIPSDRKGLTFKYSSGLAPLVTTKRYAELIDNYKKEGPSAFPHILGLGGMAIDTSRNRNKWRVPLEDLQAIADQLKGLPLMKDHDIDHVDSIIGKVEEAWVEPDKNDPTAGKVFWKGETCDENIIQKILLGYIKHNSIQIAVPNAYCDDCMTAQGKSEQEAAIEDLDLPCPRCGSLNMLIRRPAALEQSIIAIPAYEHADITPFGFKASLDYALRARYEPKVAPPTVKPVPKAAKIVLPNFTPMLFEAMNAVRMVTAEVVEMQLRMAKMALEGYPEDRVEIRYSQKARDLDLDKPIEEYGFSPEEEAFMKSLGQPVDEPKEEEDETWGGVSCQNFGCNCPSSCRCGDCEMCGAKTEEAKGGSLEDFPLVEKGGEKDKKEEGKCVCSHVRGYHQEDGCHAPTSYFPGAADCPCLVYEEAGKEEGVLQKLRIKPHEGMDWCPDCTGIGRFPISGADCETCGGSGEVPKEGRQEEAEPKEQYKCPCGCGQMVDEETYLDVIGRDETPDMFGN